MSAPRLRMRDAFLQAVRERMAAEDDVFFLTADFGSPVLDAVQREFPDRFLNMGISEQNTVNVATGLALEGFRVAAYAIAPFITMRCLEQIRINLAILSQVRPMNVTLAGVGAGFSYEVSGPTHQALEDIAVMRALPNMGVWSPADAATAAAMARRALDETGVRYLRLDSHPLPDLGAAPTAEELRRGFRLGGEPGAVAAIASTGYMSHLAAGVRDELEAGGIPVLTVDMMNLTTPDLDALAAALSPCRAILTMEEGFVGRGGMDALMALSLAPRLPKATWAHAGLAPHYSFEIGPRDDLLAAHGLSRAALAERVIGLING
ncbi:MAG: transketolase [Kiritimatiellae bacterium]|nr:transketolase [Kiritimatiellia bacterium]